MIEVEVKATAKNFNSIVKRLNRIGAKFIKRERQEDRVFGHPKFLDSENKVIENGILARIRTSGKEHALEFKEIVRHGGGIEIKSDLGDINMGLELLRKLEFNEAFRVSKMRELYSYNDLKICLDNVNELGSFIEIEKLISEGDDKQKARKECIDLLGILLPEAQIEDRKYGDMMQEIINRKVHMS